METSYKEIESVSFPSDLKNLRIAETLIDDVCKNYDVHEDHYGNILISVTEAVNNAIQHGNLEDNSKSVRISIFENEKELRFTISDDGEGFSYDNLPDPTAPENRSEEHTSELQSRPHLVC